MDDYDNLYALIWLASFSPANYPQCIPSSMVLPVMNHHHWMFFWPADPILQYFVFDLWIIEGNGHWSRMVWKIQSNRKCLNSSAIKVDGLLIMVVGLKNGGRFDWVQILSKLGFSETCGWLWWFWLIKKSLSTGPFWRLISWLRDRRAHERICIASNVFFSTYILRFARIDYCTGDSILLTLYAELLLEPELSMAITADNSLSAPAQLYPFHMIFTRPDYDEAHCFWAPPELHHI